MNTLILAAYRVRLWFSADAKKLGYRPNYSHVFLAENEEQAKAIALHSWGQDKHPEAASHVVVATLRR